ncbi:MAG: ATP-binding protein [Minicystis sp.]
MKFFARNFLGLPNVEWEPRGVCLVVGPNGSGKTSLLNALGFLLVAFSQSVPRAVQHLGGASGLKHRGAAADEPVVLGIQVDNLRWELELRVEGGSVAEFPGERLYVGQKVALRRVPFSKEWSLGEERIVDGLEDAPRTCLRAAWDRTRSDELRPLVDAIQRLRIHDQRWSVPGLWGAIPVDTTRSWLNHPGSNLFSVLNNWRGAPRRYEGQYDWLRNKARLAFYDIFDDLEIETQGDTVVARFLSPGRSESLPIRRAADGLIVGLLHLAAVAGAPDGAVVGLDEMENQLHPHAIRVLLEAMRERAEERNLTILLTTHSPVLMNEFEHDVERFFVTEPGRDRTPVRLDELHDPRYLSQFSLGDLYDRMKIGAPPPFDSSSPADG